MAATTGVGVGMTGILEISAVLFRGNVVMIPTVGYGEQEEEWEGLP